MTIKIDAHQHYWDPGRGDYDWMPQDDPILARVYAPADLAPFEDLAARRQMTLRALVRRMAEQPEQVAALGKNRDTAMATVATLWAAAARLLGER